MHVRQWRVDVFLAEEGDLTTARAVLHADSPREVAGSGSAHRNPHDASVPEIGDEVAAARALGNLSSELLRMAFTDLEVTGADDYRAG